MAPRSPPHTNSCNVQAEALPAAPTCLSRARPASLRTVGYYFHGDDFESYTPKLLSRAAQAVLDEEEPPEPAPPAP